MARLALLIRDRMVKWTTWEYWPWWLANVPVYGFYVWYALRSRHLFFFSSVNPAIPLGGAMGESKKDILRLLPGDILPKTVIAGAGERFDAVWARIREAGMEFPLIAKPDVGERGFLVKKVTDKQSLQAHLERYPAVFIVQEFLQLPLEMSVLFHNMPDGSRFRITSLCVKEFLQVQGDGRSTVRALMMQNPRAAFQLPRFEREFPELLNRVPEPGETLLLEPIGNHARGTKFLNGNHLIDQPLVDAFEAVCRHIPGVLYGRFDLKCASVEALRSGAFKVMELNGVFGEPAHVYDPAHGMWRAYRDFYRHWRILFEIARRQRRLGVQPTPHGEAWQWIREYFRYKKTLEQL